MIELEKIKSPKFLKSLSYKELDELADQIRKFILENISKTGGHLSSNLGAIELTIALHYVFDSPHDKLIFDVGHQTYTHKILTGRAKDFKSLRQKDGISGFLKYNESEHDVWEAGHSSTSISAAAGFVQARMAGQYVGEVISIIGDASIQNGLSMAAINYLATLPNQKTIIILNDNDMSISKNVGGLSKIFNKIRIRKSYQLLKKYSPRFVQGFFRNTINAFKTYVYGSSFITSLGFRYFGPIDGHNIRSLIKYFEYAKKSNRSILIHVKTIKGKGYKFSENDQVGKWHGIGPFDLETGKSLGKVDENIVSWSNGISNLIKEEASLNKKIKVISPAMIYGSGLLEFQKQLPDQLIDVGISEEHAVVMASAMARGGLIPVVSIYSTFLQRAYDQLNHDIARVNSHVVFLIDRAGIVGADGSTHQGTFDVAYLSHLPNFIITMPKNLQEAKALIKFALYQTSSPIAIRYPRGNVEKINDDELIDNIELGKFEVVLNIEEVNVITYGPSLNQFKKEILSKNIKVGLINARFIKPLDIDLLKKLRDKKVVIYEEVILNSSLSNAVINANLTYELNMKISSYGIDDVYVTHGEVDKVKKSLGLNISDILNRL